MSKRIEDKFITGKESVGHEVKYWVRINKIRPYISYGKIIKFHKQGRQKGRYLIESVSGGKYWKYRSDFDIVTKTA